MDETIDLKALYELTKSEHEAIGQRFKEFAEGHKQLTATVTAQQTTIDELKTQANRPHVTEIETKDKVSPEKKAFTEYLRGGLDTVTDKKALYRSDFQSGGIFAHPEWVKELIRNVTDISPMRSLVRVRSTSNYAVRVPKYTGSGPVITKIDEKGTVTETPITTPFGFEELSMHEKYAYVDISQQDVEDTDFDIEGFIRDEIALQFAFQEGKDILLGTGVGEPFGILDASSGIGGVTTTGSHAIASDDVMELYFALKSPYLGNARFVMNRIIEKTVFELKDSALHYLWQPDFQAGLGAVPLLGKPVVEAPDMESVIAHPAVPKIMVFGDFNQAYWLVDRKQIEVVRDPLTKADQGLIHYVARRRYGGRVVKPEALKVMTIKD